MLWLFRFLNGEICVSLSGERAEELLSRLAANGVILRRIYYGKKEIFAWMDRSGFRVLRRYRNGTGVRVRIRKKSGLPFLLFRYRGRYGIPVGILCYVLVIVFLSRFIWDVRVTGNHDISPEVILADAAEIGLKSGRPIGRISTKTDAQRLMLRNDGLSWASVNREGCFLEINVSEIRNSVPEDHGEARDLYAAADGIVRQLDIRSGTPRVRVGDAVSKGDLLVNGIVELPGSTSFVQAVGTVTADVERVITVKQSRYQTEVVPTGKIRTHSAIDFFGIRFPLYLGNFSGKAWYETDRKQLHLLGKPLPIVKTTLKRKAYRTQKVEYTDEQVRRILKKQTDEHLKHIDPKKYRLISEESYSEGNQIILSSKFICEENIAAPKKIILSSDDTLK